VTQANNAHKRKRLADPDDRQTKDQSGSSTAPAVNGQRIPANRNQLTNSDPAPIARVTTISARAHLPTAMRGTSAVLKPQHRHDPAPRFNHMTQHIADSFATASNTGNPCCPCASRPTSSASDCIGRIVAGQKRATVEIRLRVSRSSEQPPRTACHARASGGATAKSSR